MARTKSGDGQRRARGPHGTDRGDGTFVSVYCDGTGTHDKRRIASLTPDTHNGGIVWRVDSSNYWDPASPQLVPNAGRVAQWLVGNEWVSPDNVREAPGLRMRWLFRCGACRRARAIGTPSDLYPFLTLLVQCGLQEVELTHLINWTPHDTLIDTQ